MTIACYSFFLITKNINYVMRKGHIWKILCLFVSVFNIYDYPLFSFEQQRLNQLKCVASYYQIVYEKSMWALTVKITINYFYLIWKHYLSHRYILCLTLKDNSICIRENNLHSLLNNMEHDKGRLEENWEKRQSLVTVFL